jgi:hypothetical protein
LFAEAVIISMVQPLRGNMKSIESNLEFFLTDDKMLQQHTV